jgi:glycosyltransferase involved in cell wall biosynthesis
MSARPPFDIAYVGFVTGHGGDAVQMQLLADGMHRQGARVQIVLPRLETSVGFAARSEELGIECVRSDLIRADPSGPRQDFRSMLKLIGEVDAPLIHFHTGNSCLPRMLMAALELTRHQRCFVTLQSPYETIEANSMRARWWALSARRRLHAAVSPSEHGSSFQRSCGLPAERVVTVRNSIDTSAMGAGDGLRVRAELGLGPDDPLIVFTSRIDEQKRPVDAVRIFGRIADGHPSAQMVFVGTGAESGPVRTAANELGLSDRVRMVGHRTDIPDWLAAATVWILPTERENFSVAVLEAAMAKIATLACV